ncbi:unnamed protein product [Onchocerca ochengi]|uniref:Transposase n=1 Tax=Onchocerca ochengi TaxID=42157 RepID=A0A182EYK4_ONCOC|nr:unnamed protein product [Onchocerca ochengi]
MKRVLPLASELCRMNLDHPQAKKNGGNMKLESNRVERIDMRRDIPLIINARYKNDFDEGMILMHKALCRQEMPVVTL